jgi:hypothetical protein
MEIKMNKYRKNAEHPAVPTATAPTPGDFPVGSARSRAAARAILEKRAVEERKIEKAQFAKLTPFQAAWAEGYTGPKKYIAAGLAAAVEERGRVFGFALLTAEEIRHKRAVAAEIDRISNRRGFWLSMYDTPEWERLASIAEQNLRGKECDH